MKKLLSIITIVFILLSCDTDDMSNELNPFIGNWLATDQIGTTSLISAIYFTENTFSYQIINMDFSDPLNPPVNTEKKYEGNFRYNENSATIFFEILEPENEKGVTSSQYQFYGDKLYCHGSKFLVTETLHEKQTLPQ